jgi:hypothetical protein
MKHVLLIFIASCSLSTAIAAERVQKSEVQTAPLVISGEEVKPQRMKKLPYYTRAATTPDVNQHMTWGQFIDQLPVKPPSIRAKYRPPQEIDLDWRVFEQNFCAPASVANNLMWLDTNYFPQISKETNALAGGVFLARQLSGDDYFSTMNEPGNPDGADPSFHLSEGTGTTFEAMINGTVRFLKEKDIPVKEVRWISLWAVPEAKAKLKVGGAPLVMQRGFPTLDEVRSALQSRSVVVQIIGFYEFQVGEADDNGVKPDSLVRTGGHYFSPVGFGRDADGNLSRDTFEYRDPASDKQDKQALHYHLWVTPTGQYRNLPLRKFRDGGAKYGSLACPNEKKGWECLGRLNKTYLRGKQVEEHKGNERITVLEGMMVIRL